MGRGKDAAGAVADWRSANSPLVRQDSLLSTCRNLIHEVERLAMTTLWRSGADAERAPRDVATAPRPAIPPRPLFIACI